MKPARSRTASIRLSAENFTAGRRVAALTGRTLSSMAQHALVLYMRKNYPMAFNTDARLVLRLDEAPDEAPDEANDSQVELPLPEQVT